MFVDFNDSSLRVKQRIAVNNNANFATPPQFETKITQSPFVVENELQNTQKVAQKPYLVLDGVGYLNVQQGKKAGSEDTVQGQYMGDSIFFVWDQPFKAKEIRYIIFRYRVPYPGRAVYISTKSNKGGDALFAVTDNESVGFINPERN